MLTVPGNPNEDNPAVADDPMPALAGKGSAAAAGRAAGRAADAGHVGCRGAQRMLMAILDAGVTEYVTKDAGSRTRGC